MGKRGIVTGLRSTLEANGDLHGTFLASDSIDLYYFTFNWTNAAQKAALILPGFVDIGYLHVVFIGNNRQVTSGPSALNRYQGYFGY